MQYPWCSKLIFSAGKSAGFAGKSHTVISDYFEYQVSMTYIVVISRDLQDRSLYQQDL